jgi:lipopolysaccharide transport system permease protein
MKAELQELYKYREILFMVAYRDIKVRYKQSIMGFFWAILMPILIVMSGVIVRYAYALAAHVPLNREDIASVAVKSVPWAFIASGVRFSCFSLASNMGLVLKIYFPKEIFPMAAVLACLFDFGVASVAMVIFLSFLKIGYSIYLFWVPILLFLIMMLITGMGMVVSACGLFFRDVKYLVEVFITFGIFFTPVFYDVRMLGSKGKWLMLNPAAPLLDGMSACVVHHQSPDLPWLAYSAVFSVLVFFLGFSFFKHLEPAFAESI